MNLILSLISLLLVTLPLTVFLVFLALLQIPYVERTPWQGWLWLKLIMLAAWQPFRWLTLSAVLFNVVRIGVAVWPHLHPLAVSRHGDFLPPLSDDFLKLMGMVLGLCLAMGSAVLLAQWKMTRRKPLV